MQPQPVTSRGRMQSESHLLIQSFCSSFIIIHSAPHTHTSQLLFEVCIVLIVNHTPATMLTHMHNVKVQFILFTPSHFNPSNSLPSDSLLHPFIPFTVHASYPSHFTHFTTSHQHTLTPTHPHTNTPTHQHTLTPTHQHSHQHTNTHTNTPIHQHTNTPIHQYTNTPTHQYTNTNTQHNTSTSVKQS
jgi:hypothetical protein